MYHAMQILLSLVQAAKYDKLSSQVNALSICFSAIFKLFFADAINQKSRSQLSWKYTNLFLFYPE